MNKRNLMALGILGIMLTSGCKKQTNNSQNIIKLDIENIPNRIVTNNKIYYKKEDIYLIFDTKDGKCQEFLLSDFNDVLGQKIYDIKNNQMIFSTENRKNIYYQYVKNQLNVVFFENIDYYITGLEDKEYYTIDEIRYLEPYIFQSIIIKMQEEKELIR